MAVDATAAPTPWEGNGGAGAPPPAESAAAVAGDGAAPKVNPILLDMRCCQFFQLLGPHPLRYYTLIRDREAFDGVFFQVACACACGVFCL